MREIGIPQEEIAATMGISHPTLRRYFDREIQTGTHKANAKIAESLYNAAIKGKGQLAVTAAIFWLKCRAGWKETAILQHHGKLEVLAGHPDGLCRALSDWSAELKMLEEGGLV